MCLVLEGLVGVLLDCIIVSQIHFRKTVEKYVSFLRYGF